jgi:hypothetical protein
MRFHRSGHHRSNHSRCDLRGRRTLGEKDVPEGDDKVLHQKGAVQGGGRRAVITPPLLLRTPAGTKGRAKRDKEEMEADAGERTAAAEAAAGQEVAAGLWASAGGGLVGWKASGR